MALTAAEGEAGYPGRALRVGPGAGACLDSAVVAAPTPSRKREHDRVADGRPAVAALDRVADGRPTAAAELSA
eukprot:15446503-Alexandrium_andersonii.AAC.1